MKIAVIGAGAIGNLVAGYLKFKEQDVTLVGRYSNVEDIKKHGLSITGSRGNIQVKEINCQYALKEAPDLAILAVKTQDCERAVKDNHIYLKEATVLTTQNGVQADYILSRLIHKDNIISSILMFGASALESYKVVHNFEGRWIIGRLFAKTAGKDMMLEQVRQVLNKAFPTVISEDIKGMKYLKIFLNANNCIPAILGVSMQEAFSDVAISRISIEIWKEGLEVMNKAGIKLVSLPDFSEERVIKLVSMPIEESARIFSDMMVNLSVEPLYGSILQSIKKNRRSEVDYINGEFVSLAKGNNMQARLNDKLVNMVHQVEMNRKFFSKEQLLSEVKRVLG